MPESLGARLRRRREEQQIALSTIAERTKIKASLLDALERDDVSHWPAGIYRRAFIRSYASAVGLDPDTIVREFLELHPDPEETVAETPPPQGGFRGVFGLALGSLARLGRAPAPEPPAPLPAPLDLETIVAAAPLSRETEPNERDDTPVSEDVPLTDEAHVLPAFEPAREVLAAEEVPVHDPDPLTPTFVADLDAVARVCTGFARLQSGEELPPLLEQMARVLGARGLIAWVWDPIFDGLRPVLAHGYSPALLTHLPTVRRDDDNATSAAFRSEEPCAIKGTEDASGALVVPLVSADGACGALAIELPHGWEQDAALRALATICAAVLAPLIGVSRAAHPAPIEEPAAAPAAFTPTARSNGRR